MRKPVIAGNWKMYKTVSESVETALALKPLVANANHCEVVIAPVFTALKTSSAEVGHGAHTGEVAADMLSDVGCAYVIVGHSERRQHYFETDTMVSRKVQAGLSAGLSLLLCVGETLAPG